MRGEAEKQRAGVSGGEDERPFLFEEVFVELAARKVKYLVIGGIAVNLYGFERATGDLDLAVSFEPENMRRFIGAVKSLGWGPRAPASLEDFADSEQRDLWKKGKGIKVFSLYNPRNEAEQMDVMTENYIDFDKAYRAKRVFSIRAIQISVASLPDLIQLKKIAGRERDKIDVGALKRIQELENEEKKD